MNGACGVISLLVCNLLLVMMIMAASEATKVVEMKTGTVVVLPMVAVCVCALLCIVGMWDFAFLFVVETERGRRRRCASSLRCSVGAVSMVQGVCVARTGWCRGWHCALSV